MTNSDYNISECSLHLGPKDEELNTSEWPEILRERISAFIDVRVKQREQQGQPRIQIGIEQSEARLLIAYAILSEIKNEREDGD